MKYLKLFENFEDYDPYELMITPPNKKAEMIVSEIKKKNKANLNLVRDLIALGADLEWQNSYGSTALHECAYQNHSRIARMLIDAGADVNIQDEDGTTALHECASYNHPKIAKMLIDAGADLNIQGNDGWTALHRCAYENDLEFSKLLIDAGADKTIPNNNGTLPYELADTQELKKLLKP